MSSRWKLTSATTVVGHLRRQKKTCPASSRTATKVALGVVVAGEQRGRRRLSHQVRLAGHETRPATCSRPPPSSPSLLSFLSWFSESRHGSSYWSTLRPADFLSDCFHFIYIPNIYNLAVVWAGAIYRPVEAIIAVQVSHLCLEMPHKIADALQACS